MHAKHTSTRFLMTLGRFVILVAILLVTVGKPLSATSAAGEPPGKLFLPFINSGKPIESDPAPLPPTAQQLIVKDYAAKLIDYNTTLLYMAYALYGDPRLPAKYGGGYMVSDPAFFSLAEDPNLPADVKARLEPFLVRPDDPKSIYNTAPAGIAPAAGESAASAQAGAMPCDQYGWTNQISQVTPIRVHAKCTGTYEQNILTTLQYIEELYEPMTGLMGKPILDDGTSGGYQIDIYLLNPIDELRRYAAQNNPLCAECGGLTRSAKPYLGDKTSSFIVLDRQLSMGGIYYKQLLAHEFFHSLEFAHNKTILSPTGKVWWFTEASAVWAEAHFVPEASAVVHKRFTYGFQKSYQSLHAFGDRNDKDRFGRIYDAYIWPFFMEQEKGPESIANAWKALETVGANIIAANQMVSDQLPFAPNFRRFALRNLNFDLEPGNPIQPRYINQDPNFPDGVRPNLLVEPPAYDPVALGKNLFFDGTLPPLVAKYYHFTFNSGVKRVDLDLNKIAVLPKVAAQAIVKERGKPWAVRDLTGKSSVQLCDIEGLYLIISNERLELGDDADFSFTMAPLAEACSCQQVQNVKSWDALMTLTYSIYAADSDVQVSETISANVTAHLTESYRNASAIGYKAENLGGNGKIHYRNLWLYPTDDYLYSDIAGDGPPTPYNRDTASGSRMALTFDLQKCTYSFYAGVWIMATETSEDDPPSSVNVGIAHAGSANYPVPDLNQVLTITDNGSFPGHTSDYIISSMDGQEFFVQDDYDIYSILGGEDKLGAAKINWVFTPSTGQ